MFLPSFTSLFKLSSKFTLRGRLCCLTLIALFSLSLKGRSAISPTKNSNLSKFCASLGGLGGQVELGFNFKRVSFLRFAVFSVILLWGLLSFWGSSEAQAADSWHATGKTPQEFIPQDPRELKATQEAKAQKASNAQTVANTQKDTAKSSSSISDNVQFQEDLIRENVVTVYTEVEHYLEDSENYGQAIRELRAIRNALVRQYDSSLWRNKQQHFTSRVEALLARFYRNDREDNLRQLRIAYTEVLMYEPAKHISINDRLRMERVLADRINLMNYRFVALWLVRHSHGGEFMPRDLEGFYMVCEQNRNCWKNFTAIYRQKLKERRQAICGFLNDDIGCERYKTFYSMWTQYINFLTKKDKSTAAARAEAYAYLLAYQEIDELPLPFIYLDSKEIRSRYFGPDTFDFGL